MWQPSFGGGENSTPCNEKKWVQIPLNKKIDENLYHCGGGLIHKVLASFKDNFTMSGMGRSLGRAPRGGRWCAYDYLYICQFWRDKGGCLDECMHVEWCHCHERRRSWHDMVQCISEAPYKSCTLEWNAKARDHQRGRALWWSYRNLYHWPGRSDEHVGGNRTKDLDTGGGQRKWRTKNKAHVIGDIGGLSLGPNMAVITFVHIVYEFGHRISGRDTN